MKYRDGQVVKFGDLVALGEDRGTVVASIDTDQYSAVCAREEWCYLERGVLVEFQRCGLTYFEEADENLELVARANDRQP